MSSVEPDGESTGLILHVQRLSTEDGPGIRSTVFFKQCPLSCRWCHNPESISAQPQLQWYSTRCMGCHSCVGACPSGCISFGPQGFLLDRARCDGCGACVEECPTNALELLGRRVRVDALAEELAKDRAYFESSGGGVTLSGGEPLAQSGFAIALLQRLKEKGIATALDTCGFAATEGMGQALRSTDTLLFDLKIMDRVSHMAFTGQPNELILKNVLLARTLREAGETGARLWIRTPLIPGATATRENIVAIGAFIAEHLDGVLERWELCAFNNLCREQYRRLGMEWAYAETPLYDTSQLDEISGWARASGVDPSRVAVTGAARAAYSRTEETRRS